MGSYQTLDAVRPRMQSGPVAMPVVDRRLVRADERSRLKPGEYRLSKSRSRFVKVGQHYAISPEVVAVIRAKRAEGLSYSAIAEKMLIAKSTVISYSRDVPTPLGRKMTCWEGGKRTKERRNKDFAERLRRAGFSYREIGENLGCGENTARRLLLDLPTPSRVFSPTRRMVPRVSKVTGFPCAELRRGQFDTGTKTNYTLSKARHILFWMLRHYNQFSYPQIAKSVGGFHHTTVMNGVKQADRAAAALGVSSKLHPLVAVRKLWEADWREVGK